MQQEVQRQTRSETIENANQHAAIKNGVCQLTHKKSIGKLACNAKPSYGFAMAAADTSSNIVHQYHFQVLETHLDTFGHMNHATYLTVFEQARWDWITERGYGLDVVQKTQIGPTILEVNIKYKRELLLREDVRIESKCTQWRGKIGNLTQKMFNKAGEECAEINLVFGVFDMAKRRLVNAPEAWLYAVGIETPKT